MLRGQIDKTMIDEEPASREQILWYWTPVIAYALLIFYFSALPHPEEQLPEFLLKRVSDKALHAVEYAVLGLLVYRALRWSAGPAASERAVLLAAVATSCYAATDEIHQVFVPLREASWLDWIADTAGGWVGVWGWSRLDRGAAAKEAGG